ncbi:MAG: AAA family ATPase, partial [Spirochaetaceae bacterium]|nr:AAA family ATPase [Spirochaetaceae bacterium]
MAPKIIYITGFRQHAGKTVASIGLISLLKKFVPPEKIGYIKPVGQELVQISGGAKVDKDVKIIEKFCGIPDMKLENLSPVQLGSGFTKTYLKNTDKTSISKGFASDIEKSFASMENKDIIIAEGTGHPGVGGIVGLSNAHVGNLIGADILYISGGGIGKTLDMLEVDLSYFLYMKSNVRGILFNRLIPDKISTVKEYITEKLLRKMYPGFKHPISIYGYLPTLEDLPNPSMAVIKKHLKKANVIGNPETEPWHKTCRSIKIISLLEEYLNLEKFLHSGDIVVIASGSKGRIKKIIEYSDKLSNPIGGLIISCVVEERGLKPENIKRIN